MSITEWFAPAPLGCGAGIVGLLIAAPQAEAMVTARDLVLYAFLFDRLNQMRH